MARLTHPVLLISLALPVPAVAQDSFPTMDWGPIMQSEAMGSATAEAARDGGGQRPTKRAGTPSTPQSEARARANCNRARGWVAEGKKHPDIPRVMMLCRQLGY